MAAVSADRTLVRITADPLSVEEAFAFVVDPAAGGTCLFVGTVRDHSDAGGVTGLTYEAWNELAEDRLRGLAAELFEGWPCR
jgi:molybdopterin synthase catalytic subunit